MAAAQDRNATLVATFLDALARADLAAIGHLLARDAVWHEPGTSPMAGDHEGKGRILRHLIDVGQLTGRTFKFEPREVAPTGEFVVARGRAVGGGNGHHLDVQGCLIFRIAEGKVAEMWSSVSDLAAFEEYWWSHCRREAG